MIEDYWQDGFIYYVTFISKHRQLKFTRALVFKSPKNHEEIKKVVLNNFNNVLKVTQIDEFENVLLLKKEFSNF